MYITRPERKMCAHISYIIPFAIMLLMLPSCRSAGSGKEQGAETPAAPVPTIVVEDGTGKPQQIPEAEISTGPEETPVLEETPVEPPAFEPVFSSEEISDEIFARMQGKSFPEECTTSREDLRYLRLAYKDKEGEPHEGEMVCNAAIADKLIDIFRQLYEADYPIERMSLVDDYDADDEMSMSANNTSCFNFRFVSGTTRVSEHGKGMAVDLNPLYNPYVRGKDGSIIEPAAGTEYADRTKDFDYKIDKEDLAYRLFTENGFTWGGSWKSVKDYQHFEFKQ